MISSSSMSDIQKLAAGESLRAKLYLPYVSDADLSAAFRKLTNGISPEIDTADKMRDQVVRPALDALPYNTEYGLMAAGLLGGGGALAAHLLSKKNKARNALVAGLLGGGAGYLAGSKGADVAKGVAAERMAPEALEAAKQAREAFSGLLGGF